MMESNPNPTSNPNGAQGVSAGAPPRPLDNDPVGQATFDYFHARDLLSRLRNQRKLLLEKLRANSENLRQVEAACGVLAERITVLRGDPHLCADEQESVLRRPPGRPRKYTRELAQDIKNRSRTRLKLLRAQIHEARQASPFVTDLYLFAQGQLKGDPDNEIHPAGERTRLAVYRDILASPPPHIRTRYSDPETGKLLPKAEEARRCSLALVHDAFKEVTQAMYASMTLLRFRRRALSKIGGV